MFISVLNEVSELVNETLILGGNASYIDLKGKGVRDNENTQGLVKHLSSKDGFALCYKLNSLYTEIANGKSYEAEGEFKKLLDSSYSNGKAFIADLDFFVSLINGSEAVGSSGMLFTKEDIFEAIAQKGNGAREGGKCENLHPLLFPSISHFTNSREMVDNVVGGYSLELKCPKKTGDGNAASINTGASSNRNKHDYIVKNVLKGAVDSLLSFGSSFGKEEEMRSLMESHGIFDKSFFSLSFNFFGNNERENAFNLIDCNSVLTEFYFSHLDSGIMSSEDFLKSLKVWSIETYDRLFALQYDDRSSVAWLLELSYNDSYNPLDGDREIFRKSVLSPADIERSREKHFVPGQRKQSSGNNQAAEAEYCDFYSLLYYHSDYKRYSENSDFIVIGNGRMTDPDKFKLIYIPKTASIDEVLKYVKLLPARTTTCHNRCDCRIMVRDAFTL